MLEGNITLLFCSKYRKLVHDYYIVIHGIKNLSLNIKYNNHIIIFMKK